jgi:hypothetical protein
VKADTLKGLAAVLVAVIVFAAVMSARTTVGAGTYYDDGVYLALAESLAENGEYEYTNLPGNFPGVKYPPVYPLILAVGWRVFGVYPQNLPALKALNAGFYGLGAALVFLLFAAGGRGRITATALIAVGAFLWVPGMSIATVLMSEPLFLLLCALTLLNVKRALAAGDAFKAARDGISATGRKDRESASHRVEILLPSRRSSGSGATSPGEVIFTWAAVGLLAGMTFLTRSIGIALVAAVLISAWVRHHRRSSLVAAAASAAIVAPWIAWSTARSGMIPRAVTGHYGPYTEWFREGIEAGGADFLRETVAAKVSPLLETLAFAWFPDAPFTATAFVIALLSGLVLVGAVTSWRRSPAIPLFVFFYMLVVLLWPFEPYRFYYLIGPFLTLLVAEGAFELLGRRRDDVPVWARPVALVIAIILVVNVGQYHLRGWLNRAWELPQVMPAEAYAPYVDWIGRNASDDDVIAAHFDPYIYWQTKRRSVPSAEFRASGFVSPDSTGVSAGADSTGPDARPSAVDELENIVAAFAPRYLVLLDAEDVADLGVAGYRERYPDALHEVFSVPAEEGLSAGAIYEISPPSRR